MRSSNRSKFRPSKAKDKKNTDLLMAWHIKLAKDLSASVDKIEIKITKHDNSDSDDGEAGKQAEEVHE